MIRVPFLLILVFFSTAFTPNSYSIDRAEQQREQLKKGDRELLRLEKKRRNITEDASIFIEELNKLEQRMHALDRQIYTYNQMISHTQRRIGQFQKDLKGSQKKIGHRMRDIYLRRDTDYLMKAASFPDFVARFARVLCVVRTTQKSLRDFREDSARLKNIKKQLTFQLKAVLVNKKQAQDLLSIFQKKQEKSKADLTSLDQRVMQLEKESEKEQLDAFHLIQGSIEKARNEENDGQISLTRGGPLYWPVDGGPITSTFGYRFDPVLKENRLHRGIDIGGPLGAPIKAASSGKVIESRPSNGYGYIVVLYHGNGLSTLYAHMYGWTVTVKVGDSVHKGQVIAGVGSNGWSTGPHLHFEVIEGGRAKNPIEYFANHGRR